MGKAGRIAITITAIMLALLIPNLVLAPMGAPAAGSLIGLAGLGIAIAAASAGTRPALLAALLFAPATLLMTVDQGNPTFGVVALVAVAAAIGLTARRGWNKAFVLTGIASAFIASEWTPQEPLTDPFIFAFVMALYLVVVALAVGEINKRLLPPGKSADLPWERVLAYTGVLVLSTITTALIALGGDWGHTGGWLIMTPFIVIQPSARDGWRKALDRSIGTLVGFAIAYLAAAVLGSGTALMIVGYVFAIATAIALVKKWPYALYATVLTPAIVILESAGRDVDQTGDNRIIATLLGVGISLVATAVVVLFLNRQLISGRHLRSNDVHP
jgi:hypothetical protein